MFFEYPTEQDCKEIEKTYPFNNLFMATQALSDSWPSDGSIESFEANIEVYDWSQHLNARLRHTCISYVMLMFYYGKGIPDDPWFISPGKEGQSVQYLPKFEERHFWYKSQFDYYADVFYYKAFSAWDTLGHLLNVAYSLEVKKASFSSVHKHLAPLKPKLYDKLKAKVVDNSDFKEARDFRHNITHNFLPGKVGSTITKATYAGGRSVSYGVGSYTPVSRIADNAVKTLDLLAATMHIIIDDAASTETAL